MASAKKEHIKFFILLFFEITGYLFIKITADYYSTDFPVPSVPKLEFIKRMGVLDLFRCIYFASLATLYWTALNIGRFEKKAMESEIKQLTILKNNAALESSLAKYQNAYLQQQINPHLLFNSLNFIYSSVLKYSEQAAENVILLADIMRFSLQATDQNGKVELIRETEQLTKLIKINQNRFSYPMDITFLTIGDLAGHRIIPLVLMTLTENIFKHGDLNGKPALVELSVTDTGYLTFHSHNYKGAKPTEKALKSTGIANARIRLNYAYGENYNLSIHENQAAYEVLLTIQL